MKSNNLLLIIVIIFCAHLTSKAMNLEEQELRPASPRQQMTLQWIHVIDEAHQKEEYSEDIEKFFIEQVEKDSYQFSPSFMSSNIRLQIKQHLKNPSQETEKIQEKLEDYCKRAYYTKMVKDGEKELQKWKIKLAECQAKLPPKKSGSKPITPG